MTDGALRFLDNRDVEDPEPYESRQEFALDLAIVLRRAIDATDDDVVDRDLVAATLSRWRSVMTGRVVIPVTHPPEKARNILHTTGDPSVGNPTIEVPISEGMLHDIDSQLGLIEAFQEGDRDA